MKLIVQPDEGVAPIVAAIKQASKSIDIVIFRFDRAEIERALEAAVSRGVTVRTLIAHTNRGGEKTLRKLEARLLTAGVVVARTADDLVRYHGKLMIVDRTVLHIYGFNFTRLDIDKSRSFGVTLKTRAVVQEAMKLFEADATRQPYSPGHADLIVSPENARDRLAAFIKKTRKQLLVYDPHLSDNAMIRLLRERAKAGADIRVLGWLEDVGGGLKAQKFPGKRLHVRAMVRDGRRAFVGSQSLRKLELESRREVGIVVRAPKVIKQLIETFEADWALTRLGKKQLKKEGKKRRAPKKK